VQGFVLHGDTLYLLSMQGSPNGRVLALDLSKPDNGLRDARVVLPMTDDVLTGLAAARDALYVKRMRNGIDDVLRVEYRGGKTETISMPFAGSIGSFAADPAVDGIVLNVQGWTTPGAGYAWTPAAKLRPLGIADPSPSDYGMLTSTETEAVSADGTRVPLSIIHRKDVKLDGRNRALVSAYGGYGISQQPFFFPPTLEWVKAGGVFAVAHVRGGGEKGDAWHRGGQGANKRKGVEDFIACAQRLAKAGYTSPGRTALQAASMGGVLVGGAIVFDPGQFGVALVDVGVLNPVRLLAGKNGANQIGELGDPRAAEGLKALAAMDPYQNIRPGVAYPAVLLEVGLKDSRVPTWETGKFAARLRGATTSKRPIWIRTDAGEGHGAHSLAAVASRMADEYAFLDAELPGTGSAQ
jgi:prolyl oligopeptidase